MELSTAKELAFLFSKYLLWCWGPSWSDISPVLTPMQSTPTTASHSILPKGTQQVPPTKT